MEKTPAAVLDGEKEETTSRRLPDDMIEYIFSMLPAKSIFRFKCVSKYWCKLFKNPKFIKTHLKNSVKSNKFNCISVRDEHRFDKLVRKSSSLETFQDDYFEPINMMERPFEPLIGGIEWEFVRIFTHGCCNGLVLTSGRRTDGKEYYFCLWNPTTKEVKDIKHDYPCNKNSMPIECKYGLGYDCDADDYKIVKVYPVYEYDDNDGYHYYHEVAINGSEVEVYSLSQDSWKPLPDIIPYELDTNPDEAIFVNGALHWIAVPCPYSTKVLRPSSRLIVSFDIRGENFREIPLTPQVEKLFKNKKGTTLGALEGCLSVVAHDSCNVEVWVMKDQKVRESWTKLFVTQIPVDKSVHFWMKLHWDFTDGKVLFEYGSNGSSFLIYDYYKSEVSNIYRIPEWRTSIVTYVESLVPISGTYAQEPALVELIQKCFPDVIQMYYPEEELLQKYYLEEKVNRKAEYKRMQRMSKRDPSDDTKHGKRDFVDKKKFQQKPRNESSTRTSFPPSNVPPHQLHGGSSSSPSPFGTGMANDFRPPFGPSTSQVPQAHSGLASQQHPSRPNNLPASQQHSLPSNMGPPPQQHPLNMVPPPQQHPLPSNMVWPNGPPYQNVGFPNPNAMPYVPYQQPQHLYQPQMFTGFSSWLPMPQLFDPSQWPVLGPMAYGPSNIPAGMPRPMPVFMGQPGFNQGQTPMGFQGYPPRPHMNPGEQGVPSQGSINETHINVGEQGANSQGQGAQPPSTQGNFLAQNRFNSRGAAPGTRPYRCGNGRGRY